MIHNLKYIYFSDFEEPYTTCTIRFCQKRGDLRHFRSELEMVRDRALKLLHKRGLEKSIPVYLCIFFRVCSEKIEKNDFESALGSTDIQSSID